MIVAKNDIGNGLLPMKESKKKENTKTENRKAIELCNFIKNAFCISGDVELIISKNPIEFKSYFKCYDEKRGYFVVAFGEKEGKEMLK